MYTIKHAAQRVGIAPATLRAWERRYAVVAPKRTDGGYRLYDDRDIDVLCTMKRLTAEGWQPGLAAEEALRRAGTSHDAGPVTAVERAPSHPLDGAGVPDLRSDLVAAAAALDARELTTALDQLFGSSSFETVMTRHVFPALAELGDAWADGRVGVAGEHLASAAVMRRLAVAYEAAGAYGRGPRIALGMAPGSRHEIGLLAFAVAARRRGLSTDYLGADLPLEDWRTIAADERLNAVVLAVPTTADVAATGAVVEALREQRPGLTVAVGGAEQERVPGSALRLGHDLVAGAETLIAGNSGATR